MIRIKILEFFHMISFVIEFSFKSNLQPYHIKQWIGDTDDALHMVRHIDIIHSPRSSLCIVIPRTCHILCVCVCVHNKTTLVKRKSIFCYVWLCFHALGNDYDNPLKPMIWTQQNKARYIYYGPLTRYVKLQVAHAPGMPRTFSPAADFKWNH